MQTEPRWAIAFDVGGTSTKLALISDRGDMLGWSSFPTQPSSNGAYLDHLIARLRELAVLSPLPALGIAGAIAGFLDASGGLLYNPNISWLEGTEFLIELQGSFDLPVHLENDANAACAGEYLFGSGRGSRRFLCATGGTGLGIGMIVDGQIVRSAYGALGDAGHVIVVPDGPACSCGGRGCAEAVLSTAALAREYSEVMGSSLGFRDLVTAALAGEAPARPILERAGHHLGIALASLASIFFPHRIAVAGGLSAAGEVLMRPVVKSFASHCGTLPRSLATVVQASTGVDAALHGAAACLFLSQPPSDP